MFDKKRISDRCDVFVVVVIDVVDVIVAVVVQIVAVTLFVVTDHITSSCGQ